MDALVEEIKFRNIRSRALPPLGCGNGGLDWDEVRPLILSKLEPLADVEIKLFEPGAAPDADESPVRTAKPRMTKFKAMVVLLLDRYAALGYRVTMLEIQKLVYFMDRSGEDTRLDFKRNKFGPYSERLNYPIQDMDGHYLVGSGDRSKVRTQVRVVESAVDSAREVMREHPDTQQRLERVFELIDGFEAPYGLELLSTVDWLVSVQNPPAHNVDDVITGVASWSARKKRMFKPDHIRLGYVRLGVNGWNSD